MGNTLKNIVGNSLLLFSSRILSKLATIISVVFIARYLGSNIYGVYSGIFAITTVAGLVSDFGLVIPTVRTVSSSIGNENAIVSRILSARVAWSLVSICMIMILGFFFRFPPLLTILFGLSSIEDVFMNGLIRTFEGRQDMKVITTFVITERFFYTTLVCVLLTMFGTIEALAVCSLVSYTTMAIFAIYLFQRKIGKLTFGFNARDVKYYSKIGFPFFVTAVGSALYYRADTLILTLHRSSAEVGIYNAAMRVFEAQTFIPLSIMATVFPALVKLSESEDPQFYHVLRQAVVLFIVLGVAVGGVVFFSSSLIIRLLFSAAYVDAGPILQILSITIVFYFIYFVFAYALMALHREMLFTIGMVIAAALNIVFNYLVIPDYGTIAASWTRVATEGILSIILGVFLFREIRMLRSGGRSLHSGTSISGAGDRLMQINTEQV